MKVWITKWALTQGILVADARIEGTWAHFGHGYGSFTVGKNDWYDNEMDAYQRVSNMRDNKIASLRRKLEKLQNMQELQTFPVREWK